MLVFTPEEIRTFEDLLIARVQRWEAVTPMETQVPVVGASLAGRYPETELRTVVRFGPERRVGWRWRVWDPDQVAADGYGITEDAGPIRFGGIAESAADWAEMAYGTLIEDLSTLTAGVVLDPPDGAGVRWLKFIST